jgi:hypothetical protein
VRRAPQRLQSCFDVSWPSSNPFMTRQSQRADMRHKPAKANAPQSLPSVPALVD